MKRTIFGLIGIGLLAGGMVYLSSCAAQKGPLNPGAGLLSPNHSAQGMLPTVVSVSANNSAPLALSGTVQVVFNTAMNASSFNGSTVQIATESTDGHRENAYANYTLAYDPAIKTLFIRPTSGYWDDNTVYHLVLTPGITSIAGVQLDGNANGILESATFDTYNNQFYTGLPAAPGYLFGPLSLTGLTVATNYTSLNLLTASSVGSLNVSYTYVTITAIFSEQFVAGTTWDAAASFTDNLGAVPAPNVVNVFSNSITASFALNPAATYKLVFKGGANGMRTSLEATNHLMLIGRYFDGNANDTGGSHGTGRLSGAAETSDDTRPFIFGTLRADGSSTTPPTAATANVTYDSTGRVWTVVFTTPSGNTKMDASTLNVSNLLLLTYPSYSLNGAPSGLLQAKDIVYDVASNTLMVYMPDTFGTPVNGTPASAYVGLNISHNVKSSDGLGFDGNGNGIGGEQGKDDSTYGDNSSTLPVYVNSLR